jgi:predicted nucleic acid-binding protein
MTDGVLLDAGPLGMISHPRPSNDIIAWVVNLTAAGIDVYIPEVCDYEIRRELLRVKRTAGIRRLDQLQTWLHYLPINTRAMLTAAQFWADVRKRGRPTGSELSLDADAVLAGQAATLGNDTIVASLNPKHLTRFVAAAHWQDIKP